MGARVVVVVVLVWVAARTQGNRIVGGEVADIRDFPFLASLQRRQTGHSCVANIVTYSWLVTAAHCVFSAVPSYPSEYTVLAGVTNLTYDDNMKQAQRGWPNLFVVHPLVRVGGTYDYDLAMVRLQSPLREGPRVHTVPLPHDVMSLKILYTENCTVAGWGNTEKVEARRKDRTLMKVDLQLVDTEECSETLHRHLRENTHICTYTIDKDACQGDSGAALLCHGVQVGVVSWGMGCASRFPGVYARLDTQLPWMLQVIAGAPPQLPSVALWAACSLAAVRLYLP
ncbi:transmembrane protease serine 9-like [Schistocerca piceifrons]|uniref:transmembrane protease serine 9-like n=1 Tax=Schistocerca piceifrons TaxID=274613 RepID=UPI001F5E5DA2|nr:transmembrane protease serine 9-like [Schistocerca piceifrons]